METEIIMTPVVIVDGEAVMTRQESVQLGQWRDEHPHANGGVTVAETAALACWFMQRPGIQSGLAKLEKMN